VSARVCLDCGRAFQPVPGRRRNNRCPEHAELQHQADTKRKTHWNKTHPGARRVYQTQAWQKARQAVLERDDHTCRRCGQPGNVVHHQVPARVSDEPYDPDLLITVCRRCSGELDGGRRYAKAASWNASGQR
jgi:5-methylcytosine-specific restriction endonuclease McrA